MGLKAAKCLFVQFKQNRGCEWTSVSVFSIWK